MRTPKAEVILPNYHEAEMADEQSDTPVNDEELTAVKDLAKPLDVS